MDVCELNPFITGFSQDNEAWCGAFKHREDFVRVKKGRWVWNRNGWWECSECGCSPADWEPSHSNEFGLPPYCHGCGSDMGVEG